MPKKDTKLQKLSEIIPITLEEIRGLGIKDLELPKGSPPHDTIQRVFFILRPDELQRMLVNILIQLITTAGKCLDEYLYRNDALGCCIRDVGRYLKESEHAATTITIREYFITDDIQWSEDRDQWEKLSCIGYERKTIMKKKTNEVHVEERYYLCSIPPIADLLGTAVRRHWHIENGLHWTLDVVFREDKLRSKEKKGIHNLDLIRRFVMFIIKLLKVYYHRSMKRIRNKIGRNLETEIPVLLAVLKVLYDNDFKKP